jgi:hypothetical protein
MRVLSKSFYNLLSLRFCVKYFFGDADERILFASNFHKAESAIQLRIFRVTIENWKSREKK